MKPDEIIKIREDMGMTQEKFCQEFGICAGTWKNWEQGIRKPNKHSISYLKVIRQFPDSVREVLKK